MPRPGVVGSLEFEACIWLGSRVFLLPVSDAEVVATLLEEYKKHEPGGIDKNEDAKKRSEETLWMAQGSCKEGLDPLATCFDSSYCTLEIVELLSGWVRFFPPGDFLLSM